MCMYVYANEYTTEILSDCTNSKTQLSKSLFNCKKISMLITSTRLIIIAERCIDFKSYTMLSIILKFENNESAASKNLWFISITFLLLCNFLG